MLNLINTEKIFFDRLTSNVKIVTAPESQLRSLENEPIEYVSETRESDSEWDSLLKFALRKAER